MEVLAQLQVRQHHHDGLDWQTGPPPYYRSSTLQDGYTLHQAIQLEDLEYQKLQVAGMFLSMDIQVQEWIIVGSITILGLIFPMV